ncbi:hypothetical protein HanPI659440_Chr13g0513091 [Helianthus annuus]|nr:hypothetical protein HanPI659440_Chr13g0513091 [Helianthus annuus]
MRDMLSFVYCSDRYREHVVGIRLNIVSRHPFHMEGFHWPQVWSTHISIFISRLLSLSRSSPWYPVTVCIAPSRRVGTGL